MRNLEIRAEIVTGQTRSLFSYAGCGIQSGISSFQFHELVGFEDPRFCRATGAWNPMARFLIDLHIVYYMLTKELVLKFSMGLGAEIYRSRVIICLINSSILYIGDFVQPNHGKAASEIVDSCSMATFRIVNMSEHFFHLIFRYQSYFVIEA